MTTFYAATRFCQDGNEFKCTWDLSATKGCPTDDDTINHLTSILEENCEDTWGRDEDEEVQELNLYGLSPEAFARELVLNEAKSAESFGTTWEISTKWVEVDAENWEHPCNL